MYAFAELVTSKVPEMFPNVRFGFIESGASWIPYVMSQLGATKRAELRGKQAKVPHLFDLDPEIFRKNRAFITIDPIDDVESILKFHTEDSLMIGTDYSHTDISANPERDQRGAHLDGRGPDQQRAGREDPEHQFSGVLRAVVRSGLSG